MTLAARAEKRRASLWENPMIAMLQGLRELLARFRSDRRANVTVTFALALIPTMGLVGAGIDYSRANSVKSRLQTSADAAALIAARGSYSSDAARVTAATGAFNANYVVPSSPATPTVAIGSGTVTVTASAVVRTTLLSGLGIKSVTVSATSVASFAGSPSACVLALQTSNDGIFVHGGSSLKATCGLYADSTSSNGIDFDGDSVTTASSICVVKGYTKDSSAKVSPSPATGCPNLVDPLANLAAPSKATASCTYNNFEVSGTATLNPGVYCGGINIDSSAKATFNPGIYVIRDGQFNIGSSATVTGQRVMFYLTGSDANLNQGSSSSMNFTAPTSGNYQGIVFFQDRNASTPANQFGGSSTTVIQGTVYFPNGTAEINCNGTVMANGDYTVWIVKRLQIDSGASLQVNSNYSGSATPIPNAVSNMVIGTSAYLTH
jgi:Flp pilus assembly protein TadG